MFNLTRSIGPIATVTPLYHFSSRTAELFIDKGVHIQKYDPGVQFDEVVSRHLQAYEPHCLLWLDPVIRGDVVFSADLLEQAIKGDRGVVPRFTDWALNLLLALRLFKPGYLRAGETFIVFRGAEDEPWRALGSSRASLMVVDYGIRNAIYIVRSGG